MLTDNTVVAIHQLLQQAIRIAASALAVKRLRGW